MKRTLLCTLACILAMAGLKAENVKIYDLVAGHDYYIYNCHYGRLLTAHSSNSKPALVAYNAEADDQYLFTAEEAPTKGYVMLKHKATGRYLAASTSNQYSMLLQASSGTGNAYQWSARPGLKGQLVNKRSTSAALGVDEEQTGEYIDVWYDKEQGAATTQFQIFESNGEGMESSRKAWSVVELDNVARYLEQEIVNTKYPAAYRKKLPSSIAVAKAWVAAPEEKTADQIVAKATVLRDSLGVMTSYESYVFLTSTDMSSFSSTFSLGIAQFALSDSFAEDSVYMLIRSYEGRGVRYPMRESGDYAFVYQDAQVKVYVNGTLKETLDTYCVPKFSAQDTEAEWTLIRRSRLGSAQPEILSEKSAVTASGQVYQDKYGNNVRTVVSLNRVNMDLEGQIDFHLISESAALNQSTINLKGSQAWLIFDNTRPSDVISNFLSQVKINDATAKNGENCRVAIYLNGAAVMPYDQTAEVFVGYDGEQYTGSSQGYGVGMVSKMGKNANRFRSFRLKRGYMVTLASNENGGGYSRVYVADHNDIEVPVLPKALYGRISSLTVKKWQYVSKKGWCSTTGSDAIKTECRKVRATWFYTWSADRSSTTDCEYIPIRQHIYWPSISQIKGHNDATACLSINEPEHSEQHDNCDCKGAVSAWTACTLTPDFQQTGMRIGSPAPTDASWLTEYITNCNNMAYRCDFVAIHCYWGTNEAYDAKAWYNQLKSIYNNTKRPIWITEWNNGASWTTESWPSNYSDQLEKQRKAVKEIQHMMDTCSFIERYAFYNWDTYYRAAINWDDGNVLPAGKVYRDSKSDFAYNANVQFTPVWWQPSLSTPTLTARINDADATLVVTINNGNADLTDVLTVQRRNGSGQWEDYYTEEQRYKFDSSTLSYAFPLTDFDTDNTQLRVYVKRTVGDSSTSAAVSIGYIQNPNIEVSKKSEVPGWTCTKSASAGFTKADSGDTYMEVWNSQASGIQFDYYQDIEDLVDGVYELSAAVFNSTDKVNGATVNGSVVLYAQADSVQYVVPVTTDSEINYNNRITIPGIVVIGGKMRIGVKNIGEMSARWAGADEFRLVRTATLGADAHTQYMQARAEAQQNTIDLFFKSVDDDVRDASAYVINPSCKLSDKNYGWTVSNGGTDSSEPSDGVSGNTYWNLWKNSGFTSTMTQDIPFLPEGKYSAKALLRGSTNETITLTATVLDAQQQTTEEQTAQLTPTGNVAPNGSSLKKGWQLVETPYVIVRPGQTLRISMKAVTTASGWWSADDYGLNWQYVEPLPDGIADVNENGNGNESGNFFDLSGRRVMRPTKGIYIRNGKKVVVR